ncbi:hypothetical protein [Halorussus salinisoli]|uniref:hypothetical protein n=1 Tax=Halorussus salinisoli TaxID=2558242 RepID=UPI0010C19D76|nr:hypothetical protein [Halorussus salinisoli]
MGSPAVHGGEDVTLRRIGLATPSTDVLAAVHDVQVIQETEGLDAIVEDHDTIVDTIVTPTQTITVADTPPKPKGIHWSLLDEDEIKSIPPLQVLWERDDQPVR